MIFAHEKGVGKPLQGKIFIQMFLDVFYQTLKKRRFLRLDFRVLLCVDDTVQKQDKVVDAEWNLRVASKAPVVHFFQQTEDF